MKKNKEKTCGNHPVLEDLFQQKNIGNRRFRKKMEGILEIATLKGVELSYKTSAKKDGDKSNYNLRYRGYYEIEDTLLGIDNFSDTVLLRCINPPNFSLVFVRYCISGESFGGLT